MNVAHAKAECADTAKRVDGYLTLRHDELFGTVQRCIANLLHVDPATVRPERSIIDDFALESIDLLDLTFQLEKAVGVKIPRGGIRETLRTRLGDEFEKDGVLSEDALACLRLLMPEVDQTRLAAGLSAAGISDLFTVETFVRLLAWQLAERESEGGVRC